MNEEKPLEIAGHLITINNFPVRKNPIRTDQDRIRENVWWRKNMLEASLVCARMGLMNEAKDLKAQADTWKKLSTV